jgi:chitosanase
VSFSQLSLKTAIPALLATAAIVTISASRSSTGQAVITRAPRVSASTSANSNQNPTGLETPEMKEVALELVSSAENSTLNWRSQYAYIENIGDGRGYTAGIMGYCSGTGDMLQVIQHYTTLQPNNILAQYLPVLKNRYETFVDNGFEPSPASASLQGLEPDFVANWKQAAKDPEFQQAQNWERDQVYFNPAVKQAQADGLHDLGQYIYFDTAVNVGEATSSDFQSLRMDAMKQAKTPAQGGNEAAYLRAFLQVRLQAMKNGDYGPTDRVTTEQLKFLETGNLNLQLPLYCSTYGDQYSITTPPESS